MYSPLIDSFLAHWHPVQATVDNLASVFVYAWRPGFPLTHQRGSHAVCLWYFPAEWNHRTILRTTRTALWSKQKNFRRVVTCMASWRIMHCFFPLLLRVTVPTDSKLFSVPSVNAALDKRPFFLWSASACREYTTAGWNSDGDIRRRRVTFWLTYYWVFL